MSSKDKVMAESTAALVCFAVMIGVVQFGFAMSSWNGIQSIFRVRYAKEWDCGAGPCSTATFWSSMITSATILGAMVSALTAPIYLHFLTKWWVLVILNGFLLLGWSLAQVDNIVLKCVARFIVGLAVGGFTLTCTSYALDFVPAEYKKKGWFVQLTSGMNRIGQLLASLWSLPIPAAKDLDDESFFVMNYWRVQRAFPLFLAVIMLILLWFVIPMNPLCEKQDNPNANPNPRSKIQSRSAKDPNLSWWDTFFNPRFNRAAWMAILSSTGQLSAGLLSLVFYSGALFEMIDFPPGIGRLILSGMSVLGIVPAYFVFQYYGRRTAMLLSMSLLNVLLFAMGACSILRHVVAFKDPTTAFSLAVAMVVFMALAFMVEMIGAMPVGFLYMHEVSNTKGVAMATAWNWILRLTIAMTSQTLLEHEMVGPYAFIMFGITNVMGTVAVFFTMKETKGLSEDELGNLYIPVDTGKPSEEIDSANVNIVIEVDNKKGEEVYSAQLSEKTDSVKVNIVVEVDDSEGETGDTGQPSEEIVDNNVNIADNSVSEEVYSAQLSEKTDSVKVNIVVEVDDSEGETVGSVQPSDNADSSCGTSYLER